MIKNANDITIRFNKENQFFEMIINGFKTDGILGYELCDRYDEMATIKLEIYVKSLNYEREV